METEIAIIDLVTGATGARFLLYEIDESEVRVLRESFGRENHPVSGSRCHPL